MLWELYSVKWQFLEHNTVLQTMDPITEVAPDDDLAGVYSPRGDPYPRQDKAGRHRRSHHSE